MAKHALKQERHPSSALTRMGHSNWTQRLDVSLLVIDTTVQRGHVDMERAQQIAGELDIDALGIITVSRRANGGYYIVDGAHRVTAIRMAGGENLDVFGRIFTGLTLQEEARLFRLLNNTVVPSSIDKFRVRIVEGDPVAMAINDILVKYDWEIGVPRSAGVFGAVSAIERVYRRDVSAVERTIATITQAWGHEKRAMDNRIVEGVGMIYARYGAAADDSVLVDRLVSFETGPKRLISMAQGVHDMYRISVAAGVSDILVERYNKSKKSRALPSWRS